MRRIPSLFLCMHIVGCGTSAPPPQATPDGGAVEPVPPGVVDRRFPVYQRSSILMGVDRAQDGSHLSVSDVDGVVNLSVIGPSGELVAARAYEWDGRFWPGFHGDASVTLGGHGELGQCTVAHVDSAGTVAWAYEYSSPLWGQTLCRVRALEDGGSLILVDSNPAAEEPCEFEICPGSEAVDEFSVSLMRIGPNGDLAWAQELTRGVEAKFPRQVLVDSESAWSAVEESGTLALYRNDLATGEGQDGIRVRRTSENEGAVQVNDVSIGQSGNLWISGTTLKYDPNTGGATPMGFAMGMTQDGEFIRALRIEGVDTVVSTQATGERWTIAGTTVAEDDEGSEVRAFATAIEVSDSATAVLWHKLVNIAEIPFAGLFLEDNGDFLTVSSAGPELTSLDAETGAGACDDALEPFPATLTVLTDLESSTLVAGSTALVVSREATELPQAQSAAAYSDDTCSADDDLGEPDITVMIDWTASGIGNQPPQVDIRATASGEDGECSALNVAAEWGPPGHPGNAYHMRYVSGSRWGNGEKPPISLEVPEAIAGTEYKFFAYYTDDGGGNEVAVTATFFVNGAPYTREVTLSYTGEQVELHAVTL